MKILAFNGSPVVNGNTATIINTILQSAETDGATNQYIQLSKIDNRGCMGCLYCRKYPGKCKVKDKLHNILQNIENYDAIIFGFPIYMYHVPGQMKLLLDRLFCFFDDRHRSVLTKKIKYIIVSSQKNTDQTFFKNELNWFCKIIDRLGMVKVGQIVHCASHIKPAKDDSEVLSKAINLGKMLFLEDKMTITADNLQN